MAETIPPGERRYPMQELQDAAVKLREAAKPLLDASADKDWTWRDFFTLHGADLGLIREDEEWIALLPPTLAEPLAAWLESWDGIEFTEDGAMLDDLQYALRIARVINGGEQR